MATTPKGIYYPNDYNEIADIPEDMKKMAESIEEVFEDTDSDLSDIKEEQTTQNNRLNSLEVDNTTNKSDILTNKQEINNIKTEQTEQNTNISTNATNIESLQEENENLKKIVSQLPQVPGQGTEVTLENTIEAQFTIFDVEGNSVQDGTPSPDNEVPILSAGDDENLFDKDNEEQFLQNLTPDNNGLIVSTPTSTTSPNYIRTIIIPCKSDANYAITRFLGGKTFFIYESDEYPTLNKQTTLLKRNNDVGKASEIIKTSSTAKYLLVKIYNTFASEYYSYDELISSIKIEKSNKASGYTPYGMGSINEKIINKNVWNIDKFKNLYGTNTYETYNNIECLKLAGAPQRYNFDGEENTQYTFQFKLIGSTLNNEIGAFLLVYSDGTSDYHDGILTPKTYTFTSKANKTLVRIDWSAWNAGNFIYIDKNSMQLEQGTTATPYVPHEEQDYSIFVQQPMRSIGDVRDCFVKKDGNWYERHFIGRKIFDGTESWISQQNCFTLSINDIKPTPNYADRNQLITISNYYIGQVSGYRDAVNDLNVCKAIDAGNPRQVAIKDTSKTLAEFKAWLAEQYASGKPVYVDYLLAEPLDLPCTPEQIQQLENLPSTYKDFTIIQSQDETPAYLEVSGIYDLNKLVTRTEVLESEV